MVGPAESQAQDLSRCQGWSKLKPPFLCFSLNAEVVAQISIGLLLCVAAPFLVHTPNHEVVQVFGCCEIPLTNVWAIREGIEVPPRLRENNEARAMLRQPAD